MTVETILVHRLFVIVYQIYFELREEILVLAV